jgi:hypothetical protein
MVLLLLWSLAAFGTIQRLRAVLLPHLACFCSHSGVQDVVRFTNNIQDNPWFGPAGPAMNGGPGERDLCANRLNRYQQRNMTEAKEVKTRGFGRATVKNFTIHRKVVL